MPVIPALGNLRQKDQMSEANLNETLPQKQKNKQNNK
jgi:hypothetical protein